MEKFVLLSCLLLMLYTSANTSIPGLVKDFIHVGNKLSWHEARKYCRSYSEDMFSGFDVNMMTLKHSANELSWIGLIYVNTSWKWIDGTSPSYFNWFGYTNLNNSLLLVNNQPRTYSNWITSLLCAVMDWNGFWHNRVCIEKNPFICFNKTTHIPKYWLVNENKTFIEAQSYCKRLSMILVMVKTQYEITAVIEQIRKFNSLYFWIGLSNNLLFYTQNCPVFPNWNSMQPDGQDLVNQAIPNTFCVALKDGEWYDESCLQNLPFFCSTTVRSMILVSEPKTWEEALDHCRDRYVDLVSVGSEAEQHTAARKINDVETGYVWTGLRFLAGSWFWVYGDDLQYQNWRGGAQPQCPVQHRCGALNVTTGKWESRSCVERLNFLCFQQ